MKHSDSDTPTTLSSYVGLRPAASGSSSSPTAVPYPGTATASTVSTTMMMPPPGAGGAMMPPGGGYPLGPTAAWTAAAHAEALKMSTFANGSPLQLILDVFQDHPALRSQIIGILTARLNGLAAGEARDEESA